MMFVRYENFRQYIRLYPVNAVILFLLIGVHIGFAVWSAVLGVDAEILKAVYGGFVINEQERIYPEYWRYISSIFLHGGFLHLLSNCFGVFVFAPPLERALGKVRYAVLFLFSGIVGNIFTNFLPREDGGLLSLGASGALYGVFGAYLFVMLFYRNAMDPASRSTMKTMLIIGVVYSLVITQINYMAHLGGLIGGFVLAFLYTKISQGRS